MIKPEFIEEMIQRCEKIGIIVNQIIQRAGDHILAKYLNIDPSEEKEYKKQIEWVNENYPKIANELNRATRIEYIDRIRGIKIRNYDPLLQTLRYPTIRSIFEHSFEAKEFTRNLNSGITRLRAFLGLIRSQKGSK